jgi:hypothetical protein
VGGVATHRVGVVRGHDALIDRSVVVRVGVIVTTVAVDSGAEVVLTKSGTRPQGSANRVLGTAVAAHTTPSDEAVAARRAVDQHREVAGAAVAGIAIAIEHGAAMEVVEIDSPERVVAVRKVVRGPEISVTTPTVGGVSVLGVLFVGLGGSRTDYGGAEQEHAK